MNASLAQSQRLAQRVADQVMMDMGYRGHDYEGGSNIRIVNFRKMKHLNYWARKWLKRRSAIEPIISHAKHDNRMKRNYLKGELGDQVNAILAGCGYNFRKLLRALCWQKWLRIIKALLAILQPGSRFSFQVT